MRFGGFLPGLGPATLYGFSTWFDGVDFQIEWAARFGWRCFQPIEFREWDAAQQRHAVQAMARHDLVVPGLGAYRYNMLHPDPQTRAEHLRALCHMVERAAEIGVATVETVAGSRHSRVSYAAAAGNKTPEAWAEFVQGCREVCRACEGTGVQFTIEPFIATLLDTPAAVRRALEEVARPETLRVNFDLVNFATPETAGDLRAVVDEFVALAGPSIALVHLKDVRYDPAPTTHVWEVPPGEGTVDFDHWFARLEPLKLDVPAFIEHLKDMGQMVPAWQHIRAAAARTGVL